MRSLHMIATLVRLSALALLAAPNLAWAQVNANLCGPMKTGFGPYDYRADHFKAEPGDTQTYNFKRQLVEGAHFTPNVENLIKGHSTYIGGDIDYTLRAWPNHHRALHAMQRLEKKEGTDRPRGVRWPVECYFERAVRFAPNDTVVRALYAMYLAERKRMPEALQHLDVARKQAGDNALSHYNLGLTYFELGEFENALAQAHRVQALGFSREELKVKLAARGMWREAVAGATTPDNAASAAAPASAGQR
jgi:tetratricopeptide (TPR) repeat protein